MPVIDFRTKAECTAAIRFPKLVCARFLRRVNRFLAAVQLGDDTVAVHVASPGRMGELLTPKRPVWLAPAQASGRKTAYDLTLVEHEGVLVSVDSRLPNALYWNALQQEQQMSKQPLRVEREVKHNHSRLDFCLVSPEGTCWIEVKSVTLVRDGLALFPDAPTARGRKHLLALAGLIREGQSARVVFIVQRSDAHRLAPNAETDPAFAQALYQAQRAGVDVRAHLCRVSVDEISLAAEIPVQRGERASLGETDGTRYHLSACQASQLYASRRGPGGQWPWQTVPIRGQAAIPR